MTKPEMIKQLATRETISLAKAKNVINTIFDPCDGIIAGALVIGDEVGIQGFGKISTKAHAAYEGGLGSVPAHTRVKFSPGKTLKATVN